jgi:ATP-dependent DNA helicase RecG
VGRGEHPSYCLLLSDVPFLDVREENRLSILEETNDGFRLAEKDFELRGAGDLLGTQQSGSSVFQFSMLMDGRVLAEIQQEAHLIFERDPELAQPEHHLMARLVAEQGERYGDIS